MAIKLSIRSLSTVKYIFTKLNVNALVRFNKGVPVVDVFLRFNAIKELIAAAVIKGI